MDGKELKNKVDVSALMQVPLSNWRPILSRECQVYVCGEGYLAKRFDQINYVFCDKDVAKEILIDNLYALLRYKYFTLMTEDVDNRIKKIVDNFTANLKTTLKKVSFDQQADCDIVNLIPNYCIAFRNGVYDFKNDTWLFKYDIVSLDYLKNKIYLYDDKYVIMWYMNYDFEPLGISIEDTSINDFIEIMKELTKTRRNFAFELIYNMSHNEEDKYEFSRFKHLCEILGYSVLQDFCQAFVLMIGSGQNGKNSLFDGCFTNKVVPTPAANDMDSIENDRFITGSLQNKAHNIFLETSAKTYTESKMIKALTGSMYQTIENKGQNKYSGIINCKYIFAGNDQDKIKFSDNTTGFRRRINMFEIYYRWDSAKRFLKKGDYYDTTFSDTLTEIKEDSLNTTVFLYFAMYGIMFATNNFKTNFKFSSNDWNENYSDMDLDLKDKINELDINTILKYIKTGPRAYQECEELFYDTKKVKLFKSNTLKSLGYEGYTGLIDMLISEEVRSAFFADNDVYISIRILQNIIHDMRPATTFTQDFKKVFNIKKFEMLSANKPYIKVSFVKNKIKIRG